MIYMNLTSDLFKKSCRFNRIACFVKDQRQHLCWKAGIVRSDKNFLTVLMLLNKLCGKNSFSGISTTETQAMDGFSSRKTQRPSRSSPRGMSSQLLLMMKAKPTFGEPRIVPCQHCSQSNCAPFCCINRRPTTAALAREPLNQRELVGARTLGQRGKSQNSMRTN